jgi:hypothetical protein
VQGPTGPLVVRGLIEQSGDPAELAVPGDQDDAR